MERRNCAAGFVAHLLHKVMRFISFDWNPLLFLCVPIEKPHTPWLHCFSETHAYFHVPPSNLLEWDSSYSYLLFVVPACYAFLCLCNRLRRWVIGFLFVRTKKKSSGKYTEANWIQTLSRIKEFGWHKSLYRNISNMENYNFEIRFLIPINTRVSEGKMGIFFDKKTTLPFRLWVESID